MVKFFSFGTNDLTQSTFGFSRDDIGGFLPSYLENKVWRRLHYCTTTKPPTNQSMTISSINTHKLPPHHTTPHHYPSSNTPYQVLEKDPFETLDRDGVGQLMKTAVSKGRAAQGSGVAFGICGEHGGDPQSVRVWVFD